MDTFMNIDNMLLLFWLFITNLTTTAGELKPGRSERPVSDFEDNRQGDQQSPCPSKGHTSAGQGRTVPMSLILFEEVLHNGLHNTSWFKPLFDLFTYVFNVLAMLNVFPRLMSFSLKMLDFLQLLGLSWVEPKDP